MKFKSVFGIIGASVIISASFFPQTGYAQETEDSDITQVNTELSETSKENAEELLELTENDDEKEVQKSHLMEKKESLKHDGWVKEKGSWYYYKDGKFYTGWHKMGKAEGEKKEHWSFFGKDGKLYTNWHYMTEAEGEKTPHWSYFGDNGWLRTDWVQLGKGTKEPDGNKAKHWSYFGNNGWLRTGWVQLGKGTNNPDGNAAKHWSYFGGNGWLRTGWVQLGKGTNNPDGNAAKHWSYFGGNGWLRTGWVQLGKGTNNPDGNAVKHWSYFGDNGWLRTDWVQLGKGTKDPDGNKAKHWSYFGSNGWLTTGNKKISDKVYSFNGSGWLTSSKNPLADGCYIISPSNNTNYALDVKGASAANKTALQVYKKNGSMAQKFQISGLGNDLYSIRTAATIYNSAVDVPGGNAKAGTALWQYSWNSSNAQKWKITEDGKGNYIIKSFNGNLSMDVKNGNLNRGNVILSKYTGSATQRFKLTKTSGMLVRNGRKYYFNANGDKPMIGVDVSAWSEIVDWDKVKADGIGFAIIRTAHRKAQIDPYGERNMKECERLGIPYGVYYYSLAVTDAQADAEADLMIKTVKNHNPKLGLFIDIEDNSTYEKAFGKNLESAYARRKITDITKRIVNRVKSAGYTPGVYANESMMNKILYMNELPNVRWIARYFTDRPSDTSMIDLSGKGYKIWQFTSKGKVNGIKEDADLNTLIQKYW